MFGKLLASGATAVLLQIASVPAHASVSENDARMIARDAYVYGLPMVDNYRVMYAYSIDKGNPQYKGPFNTVLNVARVFTPDDTAFVTPNSDTPYTFSGLDLRAEPVVITVPKMDPKRYFVFQLMDLFTFNFAYIGSRVTGTEGGSFLIAGPGWTGQTPTGIKSVIHSETALVSVVGRTQLFNPADLDNVKAIQAAYKVQSLSAFLGKSTPPGAPSVAWVTPISPADERTSLGFFNELAFLLQFAEPPHPSEIALRKRFATVGIEPGKPFDAASLPPAIADAMKQGMLDGQKEIDAKRASLHGDTSRLFGDRNFLKNDYVTRATGTQVDIGANSRDEALYPILDHDDRGDALDASKHRYTLRFAKDGLPPVNAFWSITMYDLPKQLLVSNPLNRYLINSPMLPQLKKDADGGLTIYIQADSPGADKEANWLPAPHGPFVAFMRYYWPKKPLLDGTWQTPAIKRID
jgi:hypothetical protein